MSWSEKSGNRAACVIRPLISSLNGRAAMRSSLSPCVDVRRGAPVRGRHDVFDGFEELGLVLALVLEL